MKQFGDNFIPVIPTLDPQFHTDDDPFCFVDPSCPRHEDAAAINRVRQQVTNGLLTPTEATRTVKGEQL